MSKYLSDEEITAIGDAWMREDFAVRTVSIGRGHWEEIARAIATAASDKAYAAGRADMARECREWWQGQADVYNAGQLLGFEAWLKSKGVM